MVEVDHKSQAIVESARDEIHALITSVESDIESNYEEMLLSGQNDAKKEIESMISHFEEERATWGKEFALQFAPAAMEISEKLISHEAKICDELVVRIARQALQLVADAKTVCLRANSLDLEMLKKEKASLLDALSNAKDIEVRVDANVKKGGVLVQTQAGVIDAQLHTQIEEMARVVTARKL